jgi:hypothetical protein
MKSVHVYFIVTCMGVCLTSMPWGPSIVARMKRSLLTSTTQLVRNQNIETGQPCKCLNTPDPDWGAAYAVMNKNHTHLE